MIISVKVDIVQKIIFKFLKTNCDIFSFFIICHMIKIFHLTSALGLLAALATYLVISKEEISFEFNKIINRPSINVFTFLKNPDSHLLACQSFKKIVIHHVLEDSSKKSKVHFSALEYFQHVGIQNVTALMVADLEFEQVSIAYLAFKGIVSVQTSYDIESSSNVTSLKFKCTLNVPWILKKFLQKRYMENYNETLYLLEELIIDF